MEDDIERNEHDRAISVFAYGFLDALREKFGFDAHDVVIRDELVSNARRYWLDQKMFDNSEDLQSVKADYQSLLNETQRFKDVLALPEYVDLDSDLYWAALHKKEPAPQTDFPGISAFERSRGKPFLFELNRLLSLLEIAADHGVENSAVAKGRRANLALENFVRRTAYVWSDLLSRKFSVDYHKGSGITEAFDFVRMLITQIDDSISKTDIITAMRKIIKERGEAGLK